MLEKTVVEATTKLDSRFSGQKVALSPKLSELTEGFLKHGQFDLSWSPETVRKYGECLRMIIRDIGDVPVIDVRLIHITELKQKILMRGAGHQGLARWFIRSKVYLDIAKMF